MWNSFLLVKEERTECFTSASSGVVRSRAPLFAEQSKRSRSSRAVAIESGAAEKAVPCCESCAMSRSAASTSDLSISSNCVCCASISFLFRLSPICIFTLCHTLRLHPHFRLSSLTAEAQMCHQLLSSITNGKKQTGSYLLSLCRVRSGCPVPD